MRLLATIIVLGILLPGVQIYAKDTTEGKPSSAIGPIRQVSIIRLIAAPEQYDKSVVRVLGFFHLEFEGSALYLHREDYENMLSNNSVPLDIPRNQGFEQYEGRYVMIQGVFKRCDDTKNNCMFSGMLTQIERIVIWPKRPSTTSRGTLGD